MTLTERIAASREAARFYREMGWNPLPSAPDRDRRKKPTISYSHLWETRVGDAPWVARPGPNVQVMTGAHWGLAVVDLDGPEAGEVWPTLGEHEPTWTSARDPTESRHVWFALPDWLPSLRSKGHLWGIPIGEDDRGRKLWAKHQAIELLADRKLVMAPPSHHPDTGQPYEWLPGHGPAEIGRPAMAPEWLLRLPDLDEPPPRVAPPGASPRPSVARPGDRYDANDVRCAVPDWVPVAASWGLRIDGRRSGPDCVKAHAIGRPDNNPSAQINTRTGVYWDPWMGGISPFDLALALGAHATFPEVVNDLGARYLGGSATTN